MLLHVRGVVAPLSLGCPHSFCSMHFVCSSNMATHIFSAPCTLDAAATWQLRPALFVKQELAAQGPERSWSQKVALAMHIANGMCSLPAEQGASRGGGLCCLCVECSGRKRRDAQRPHRQCSEEVGGVHVHLSYHWAVAAQFNRCSSQPVRYK